jgi:urate oxidase
MGIKLGRNAYGKNAVNLSKIIRHADHHEFRQVSVNVVLEGDFETAHTMGENSLILPTDTQKNTVYALAKDHFVSTIEAFGLYLANHFMINNPQLSQASIELTEYAWKRMDFNNGAHPHAYISGGSEKHTALVVQNRDGAEVTSGITDLLILKTTDSGFENYIRDQYTTLKETSDRILCTQCEVTWVYESPHVLFAGLYGSIRNTLLETFANHASLSVQHTLFAMGQAVLESYPAVREVHLKMPNKHHILYNLNQFGMENNNEVFVVTDAPYGYITGSVVRDGSSPG